MFCLNLCEVLSGALLHDHKLDAVIEKVVQDNQIDEPLERIYAGSSFCSQYFLHLACWKQLFLLCEEKGWKITLTLPVFSQKDLSWAKERIIQILEQGEGVVDEVTVNDFGMLKYISDTCNVRVNLGRLFFKDSRDIRVRPYQEGEISPNLLSCRSYFMEDNDKIKGIEIDPTNRYINLSNCDLEGVDLGVHSPFCYMTTGNICKFASIHKEPKDKFRANARCFMECTGIYEHYKECFDGKYADIIRYGRTVYFYNNGSRIAGKKIDRRIYFPILEVKEIMKEGVTDENPGALK
ncbi:MAG: hypothetical protein PUH88_08930 [Lachnospiraceae bacterium]|nr:hypothetical protein [Lachnospiraceae bacterium]